MTGLKKAELEWHDDGTPVSKKFGDVYFSIENGMAESRDVFLDGIGGPDTWNKTSCYSIGETGFGTGLNFLVTWQEWQKTSRPGQKLRYVSIEGYPLSREQLKKSLAPWEELSDFSDQLIEAYPEISPGFHSLEFDQGNVSLLLLFGEVTEVLKQFSGQVDAWYLDGFTPEKNPEMWNEEVYKLLSQCSRAKAKVATFSVASHVRKGLEAAGFEMRETRDFPHKRERLVGQLSKGKVEERPQKRAPWYQLPKLRENQQKIAIIGGGIAGNTLAYQLSRSGAEVILIDKGSALATGASGNPTAVFEPKLMRGGTLLGQFMTSSYLHALKFYEKLEAETGEEFWDHRCGVLDLIPDEKEITRRQSFRDQAELPEDHYAFVSADQASELAGVEISHSAIWYPKGGCLNTGILARALTREIDVLLDREVSSVEKVTVGTKRQWRLVFSGQEKSMDVDAVVLANAFNVRKFAQSQNLPVVMNRGQLSIRPVFSLSRNLRCVVNGGGYLTPSIDTQDISGHVFGATFERVYSYEEAEDCTNSDERHKHNLLQLNETVSQFSQNLVHDKLEGRTSVRGTTFDRFPLVGPLHVDGAYREAYKGLKNGEKSKSWPRAQYHEGLYISVGFGSRGFLTAPLMAGYLSQFIRGDLLSIPRNLIESVHPARFLIRDLKRGITTLSLVDTKAHK